MSRTLRAPPARPSTSASTVEVSPGLAWFDRILGRAAVDPAYRELLFTKTALALTGEPLPAGLVMALCDIRTRDLGEFARQALAADAAHAARAHAPTEALPVDLPELARAKRVPAAA